MNLLLYDKNIKDLNIVLESLNSNTTTNTKTKNIERLGLMYENKYHKILPFMININTKSKYKYFSNKLIDFIINKNIKIVDIITCNMNDTLFKKEAEIIS